MSNRVRSWLGVLLGATLLAGSFSASVRVQGRRVHVVRPGESIQAAIDATDPGGRVFVLPGIYRETADVTNGLNITKGISLIGLSTPMGRVVLENAGGQRNGIVVVPADRTACLNCHSSLAPPFDVLPDVPRGLKMREPMITGFSITGITIRGFLNNGLFTENLDGFVIDDVESIDNANYGIFPTLSRNGVIRRSRATGSHDSGVWVETSEKIRVSDSLVEGNLIGFELSNSDDISFIGNESRGNTIGMGLFLLPFLFDDRPGGKRITISGNFVHDNNRPNTSPPGSIIAALPRGIGILHLGLDDSEIAENRVEHNNTVGIAILDACVAWEGTGLDCAASPFVTPEFLADQDARNNRMIGNSLTGNGTNPEPSPFAFAASDLALLSFGPGNCFASNTYRTSFSLIGVLPPCR